MDCNAAMQAVQSNSECRKRYSGSQQAGAKLRRARGKQPRPPIKVPKSMLSVKVVEFLKQRGGWLRSSHPLKSA